MRRPERLGASRLQSWGGDEGSDLRQVGPMNPGQGAYLRDHFGVHGGAAAGHPLHRLDELADIADPVLEQEPRTPYVCPGQRPKIVPPSTDGLSGAP